MTENKPAVSLNGTTPPPSNSAEPKPMRKSMTMQGAAALVLVALLAKANTHFQLGFDSETLLALASFASFFVIAGLRRATGGIAAVLLMVALMAPGCAATRIDRQYAEADAKTFTYFARVARHYIADDATDELADEVCRTALASWRRRLEEELGRKIEEASSTKEADK